MTDTFTVNYLPARLLFILLMVSGLPTISFAQLGSLDKTFGTGGEVITSLGNFGDGGNSIAIQNNEKILLGGFTQDSFTSSNFALVRYDQDGTLDTTFGIGGIVKTPVENRSGGNSVVIQSDGKILLGGSSKWYLNLVRYNSDGSLDTTFGSGGKVITDIEGYYSEQCKSVAIQNDGKIILGGYGQHNSNDNSYFILVRYNTNGTLDTTFGTSGKVIGSAGKGNSVLIQNDEKIVLGGSSNSSFALVRYNANGSLDSTFGTGGKVITPVGNFSEGNSLVIQDDEKIVLGGHSSSSFALVRYNADGTLDTTFGTSGKVIGSAGKGNSVVIQSDGKIVLGGSSNSSFALERYHTNGTLDNVFGTGGKVITPVGSFSEGNSLLIQDDEKIVLGGYSHNGSDIDIALVRYNGDASVEIEETCCKQRNIRIYPNPFNSSTTIQFNAPIHNAELTIYNVYGQGVKQITNISGQEIQLTRNDLPKGIYFLYLKEKDKITLVKRLVISGK